MAIITLLLALFACSVSAYVSNFEYLAMGQLRARYADPDTASDNQGYALFNYKAKSRTLNFHVISTLASVGAVTLNGPISCYDRQTGGYFNQDDPRCTANTGQVVAKLGKGIIPEEGEALSYQIFKGSVVLSAVEEGMLFRDELNVQINSITKDPATGKTTETPGVRGQVYMFDFENQNMVSYLIFENNKGSFPDESKVKTTHSGFGFIRHDPNTNNDNFRRLQVVIYSSISKPGSYILKCPSGTHVLAQDTNPVDTTITFEDDNKLPLLLELFYGKSCYIFISSAEATTGDLFAHFVPASHFVATSLGSEVSPSPYFAFSMANFDASDKTLDILTKHNITTTITAAQVEDSQGTVLCDLANQGNPLPIRSFCRLNVTNLEDLEDEKLFINIKTQEKPEGEVRGAFTFSSRSSSSLMRSGSAGSSAVGLGVGLGVGIPLFLLAVVAAVFVAKKKGKGTF